MKTVSFNGMKGKIIVPQKQFEEMDKLHLLG